MIALPSAKDDEIAILKAVLAVAQTEWFGSDELEKLKAKNDNLSIEVARLED